MIHTRSFTLALLLGAGLPAHAAPPTAPPTAVSVSGQVRAPTTLDQAAQAALPRTTPAGPALSALIAAAGGILTDPAVKNGILRQYAIATTADGSRTVVSAAEITAGRAIPNLVNLEVATAPTQPGTGGGPTARFTVLVPQGTPMTLDLPALQALEPHTGTMTYTAGSRTVTDTYTGALLSDVLAHAGLNAPGRLVTATGSDGYQATFSATELTAGTPTPALVAYTDTAGQIAGGAGFARLVVPGDTAGGRYISNLASLTVLDVTTGSKSEKPIQIFAAGSLSAVLPKLIEASGLPAGTVAPPIFGPAGALGQRLRGAETADLFASADLAQPDAVTAAKGGTVVPFARNRMCVLAPARLGLTPGTLLDRMLSPGFRLAASTPGADPGGDYARAVFAKAETIRPGANAALVAKALLLLGGPGSMTPQPGHSPAATIILGDHADALLYYCSGTAAAAREADGMISLPVPDTLEVGPVYGLALLSNRPEAMRLALFMLSAPGQAILAQGGLLPLLP